MAVPETITGQGTLFSEIGAPVDKLNEDWGVLAVEDLDWYQQLNKSRPMTVVQYAGEIGTLLSQYPRETPVKDSALELYGKDFSQAEPANIRQGLFFPGSAFRRPRKSVVHVTLDRSITHRREYPGILPFTTGVAVPEEIYVEIIKNAPYYANQIDNKTQRANGDEPIVEARADLGGESVIYAFAQRHDILEARDQDLLSIEGVLRAVHTNVRNGNQRRILNLEPYRYEALSAIQEMVRVAGKTMGYGTNQVHATQNAVFSNTHRSPDADKWWLAYTSLASKYYEEVRGKVEQSIHGIMREIGAHVIPLSNNLYREYTDD